MFGSVTWSSPQEDTIWQDNAIGIIWAGEEAIISNYSYTDYAFLGIPGQGETTKENHFNSAINNAGVSYKFKGQWPVTLYPIFCRVYAYVEQEGLPTKIYNMNTTYIYTWLTWVYGFTLDKSGLTLSVSPTLGSRSYACVTTYGKK